VARLNPVYPLVGALAVLVACESYRASTTGPDATADGGNARTALYPIPTPVSVPGGNPTTVPVPGGPNVGGGGGGGSPSPSPSPSASPTPEPTPTPTPTPTVPCPPTLTINATSTPMLMSDAANNDALFAKVTANYDTTCVVKDVKVTMRVTTTTGFNPGFTSPTVQLGVCGSGVGFTGCSASILYSFQSNATGTQIGTTCSDFVFDTTATTPFDPAAPPAAPYSGTYQLDAARSGVGDEWHLKDLAYEFINVSGHPADAMLECARIVITTKTIAAP
jgi:hypothetical protein